MELKAALKNIGLTDKEAAVYLALAQLGRAAVYSIASKSGLKRPTTYATLDELIEKGLVERVPRTRKQHYVAKDPDEIFAVAEERLAAAKRALPELRALGKEGTGAKVHVTYHEGLLQAQNAYFDTLRTAGGEIVGWLSNTPFEKRGREFWYETYRPKRLERHIRARIIVPDEPWLRDYAADDPQALKETRIDTEQDFKTAADVLIYGDDRVVMTSFEEEMGLIIESKKIHDTLKAIFERHWQLLGRKA